MLVYLHFAAVGSLLISGFWSLINERFDPRSAKKRITRIASGGTLGGLLGGLAVERSGFRIIQETPYLKNLALLVVLGTTAATMIDYVFKAEAAARITDGDTLLRFFAIFYTLVSLATFLLQSAAARRFLTRFGLVTAVAALPSTVSLGGIGLLLFPGLAAGAALRGTESVVRSSIFRSGYELLFTPIGTREKRAAKPIIDVGFDRLGDMIGGGLIRIWIGLAAVASGSVFTAAAVLLSAASLIVARRLHVGYVNALEKSLISQAVTLDLSDATDRTTRSTVMQSLTSLSIPAILPAGDAGERKTDMRKKTSPPREDETPESKHLASLRSGDLDRIRRCLTENRELDPELAPQMISLLAWDEIKNDIAYVLLRISPQITGLLTEHLLDPEEEFAIRRRIPRILAHTVSSQSVEGLIAGLHDRRFEVRYQCGRALGAIRTKSPEIEIDRNRIMERITHEAQVDRKVWESHRLLDDVPDEENFLFVDDVLQKRSSRSQEHVFMLLSLVLPHEPLRITYRGLHCNDETLRGTALEYLESVLPERITRNLRPLLEESPGRKHDTRNREQILADLLRSNQSIEMNLDELRRKHLEE